MYVLYFNGGNMKIIEAVGKRTNELLAEKKMTKYRLERTMAIPHNTMISLMNAKHNSVNLKTVMLISKGLGVTVSEFFNHPIFESDDLDID